MKKSGTITLLHRSRRRVELKYHSEIHRKAIIKSWREEHGDIVIQINPSLRESRDSALNEMVVAKVKI